MQGITLTFERRIQTGTDAFNNPTFTVEEVEVEDCLIAPVTEPATAREQQAINQARDQVRIHLPKAFTGNVSGSRVEWDGKLFELDSDSVSFMSDNTPTRWNRYVRAECVINYQAGTSA